MAKIWPVFVGGLFTDYTTKGQVKQAADGLTAVPLGWPGVGTEGFLGRWAQNAPASFAGGLFWGDSGYS